VLLKPSFTGGARYYLEKYADAMAVVRALGHPALFINFTCNPNWKEIHEALLPQQSSHDRPDIVARVFHLKLKQLLTELTTDGVFGKCTGHVATIEFQKRGLQHVHILLFLKSASRQQSADVYDRYISAAIPSDAANQTLRTSVLRHMVHGPCVGHNPVVPCVQPDGTCSKYYPRDFAPQSVDGKGPYPMYRRRLPEEGGQRATPSHPGVMTEIDNQWIGPYSPYLMSVFDCHCSVEICSNVRAVKFLIKYVCKGPDRAMVRIVRTGEQGGDAEEAEQQQPIDEIQVFFEARFIGDSEAAWRTLTSDMVYHFPAVMKLAVHLKNEQPVYFDDGGEEAAVSGPARDTTLIAFFNLNSAPGDYIEPAADTLLYADVPGFFAWQQRTRK